MAKPSRAGKQWTPAEDRKLAQLAAGNTPTRVIGIKLHRTPTAIQSHAHELGVSLAPWNQSPYDRRK